MNYHPLGTSGLRVSDLFLGTMTFGEDWGWGASPEACRAMFDAYAEAGGNVIDTAINYTNGASERIVGDLLEADRDRFVLSTKYTLTTDPSDPNAAGNHRKNLTRSLDASLARLGTDRIDLYWVHIWDALTPIDETMRALDDAVRAGKVLYVGISDAPAWVVAQANTLARWHDWSPAVAIQVPYSLLRRDVERELLPMADAFGLSVAAWSPLAAGVLMGKFLDETGAPEKATRVSADRVSERDRHVATAVRSVANDLGVSAAQVAIAWTMHERSEGGGPRVHPIVGARTAEQLKDNLSAASLTLPRAALDALDQASAITLGFPHDFIRDTASFVYGTAGRNVVPRRASRPNPGAARPGGESAV